MTPRYGSPAGLRLAFEGRIGGGPNLPPRTDTITLARGVRPPRGYDPVPIGAVYDARTGNSRIYARRTLSASLEA